MTASGCLRIGREIGESTTNVLVSPAHVFAKMRRAGASVFQVPTERKISDPKQFVRLNLAAENRRPNSPKPLSGASTEGEKTTAVTETQ